MKFRGERYGLCETPKAGATQDSVRSQVAADRDAILTMLQDLLRDARRTRTSSAPHADGIHAASLAELNKLHAEFYGGKR